MLGDAVELSGRAAAARHASVMTAAMATDRPHRNVYDPRVRELIWANGNPDLFPELDVPRSTAAGWLRGEAGSTSEPAGQEPRRDVRDLHGDVAANDGPRERSMIEEGSQKTAEKSTVTKYRGEKSRRSWLTAGVADCAKTPCTSRA